MKTPDQSQKLSNNQLSKAKVGGPFSAKNYLNLSYLITSSDCIWKKGLYFKKLELTFDLQPICLEQSLTKFSTVKGQTHVHSADYFSFSSERRPRRPKMKD